jgi:hypothetical protein
VWRNDGTTTVEIFKDERNIILVYRKTTARHLKKEKVDIKIVLT